MLDGSPEALGNVAIATSGAQSAITVFLDCCGWLGSRVAKALDLQLVGCEFNSRPGAVE